MSEAPAPALARPRSSVGSGWLRGVLMVAGVALLAAVPAVRTEDGCEQYDLHRDRDASHRFTMIERWRDERALKVHGEAPAFQKLARELAGKATLDVVLLEKLI